MSITIECSSYRLLSTATTITLVTKAVKLARSLQATCLLLALLYFDQTSIFLTDCHSKLLQSAAQCNGIRSMWADRSRNFVNPPKVFNKEHLCSYNIKNVQTNNKINEIVAVTS
jgi:hypothetical protein